MPTNTTTPLNFSPNRTALLFATIVGLFVCLIVRVAFLQTYGRESTISRADFQQHLFLTLAARRGDIYDRNGLMMAGSVQTRSLFVDPAFMQQYFQSEGHSLVEMDEGIQKLATLLDKDPFEISRLLGDRSASRFVKVAENLDDTTAEQIDSLKIPGVGFVPGSQRWYPMGSLAAHILGGCGADGRGLDGLELKYNDLLTGKPGFAREIKDAQRRPIGVPADDYLPPEHGKHLVLTIDANLQLMAEEELRAGVEQVQASRGEIVVMDCQTGDVLALANYPTFNPQMMDESSPQVRTNNALVAPYEPGSTFKPFMASPALMWRVTTPEEMWNIPALTWFTPYGRPITDVEHYGNLCTWDGLVKSSNILMSQLAERLGNTRLRQAITSFGFGQKTGIDLPGETNGKVYPLNKWGLKSTESIAQGYEVMVTPIQLARGFCAIANGGRLVTPRLLMGTVDPRGNILSRQQRTSFDRLPRVLDADTSAEVRRILCDVVIRGTAEGARSKIWNISGKTGTAHIAEAHGYSKTRFNSSFMACAPYENPRFVVVCTIHDPNRQIAHYGGKVAAPVACKFIERALTYLEVPASPDLPLPPPQVAAHLWNYSDKVYLDRNMGAPKPESDDQQQDQQAEIDLSNP
jgi:cell division protein FtsI (penicillin-binding protein 3)